MDTHDVNGNELHGYTPELAGGASDKGPKRSENQDTFWIPEEDTATHLGALFLVADGVGGQEDGAFAAQLAAGTVQRSFYDLRLQGKAIPVALKEAVEQANQTIYDDAQKRNVRRMGSTFVAAVLDDDQLIVAHVGDARAYLIRQGEMRQLTRDDTWVQRQVDAGLITTEEAAGHEFRNVVTQVLGNKPEVTVNLSQTHMLEQGDIVLLCSDGLYDVLPDSRMVPLLTGNAAKSAARLLVEAAIDAEATDNITAVVLRTDSFVAMADEPTLVPLPIPAAPIPTMPVDNKGNVPKWLIVLAIIAVILIIAALAAFWFTSQSANGGSKAAETPLPADMLTPTEESPGALNTLELTPIIHATTETEQPAIVTIGPPATATIVPSDTATPPPTPTLAITQEPRGCANGIPLPYVWTDDQFNAGCTTTQFGLELRDEVRILSNQPVEGCGDTFIKIQSIVDATMVGWVYESSIDLLGTGENCGP